MVRDAWRASERDAGRGRAGVLIYYRRMSPSKGSAVLASVVI